MRRNVTAASFKPQVEPLEGRDLPSFLLNGSTNLLLTPLRNMVQDIQNTRQDLLAQTDFLVSRDTIARPPIINNAAQLGQIGQAFGKATADLQRMLTEFAAVDALSRQDLAFINAAAGAELSEGDAVDFFILNFGSFLHLPDFRAPFNDVRTQAANAIVDPLVFNASHFSFSFYVLSLRDTETFGPIIGTGLTSLPTF
jgi:hypothetical protein